MSDYIQTEKLTLTKELLDQVCPALGYDNTPPDPTVLCPNEGYLDPTDPDFSTDIQNYPDALAESCDTLGYIDPTDETAVGDAAEELGYILDPGKEYTPVVDIGTPNAEEILLLCTDNTPGVISFKVNTSTVVKYYAEVYDESLTLLETTAEVSSGTTLKYTFPTLNTDTNYIVKIKPVSDSITIFKVDTYTGYSTDWQIVQAKFNTPNIITLSYAFRYMKEIQSVLFDCTLDSLTTMINMFQYSGIKQFTMPDSLPEVTTMVDMFNESDIVNVTWASTATAPKLDVMTGFLQDTRNAASVSFPSNLPALSSFSNIARDSTVTNVVMPLSMGNTAGLSFSFSYSKIIGEIVVPETPLNISASGTFSYTTNVTKIVFQGTMNSVWSNSTGFYDVARGCTSLTEFEFPREMATWVNSSVCNGAGRLRKVRFPDVITASDLAALSGAQFNQILSELTGDFDNSGSVMYDAAWPYSHISIWNTPKMRVSNIRIGTSTTATAPATSVEIDWANSDYSAGSIVLYCTMDSTELNRIFTALPTVTSKTIDVRGNPGYDTCDPSIATAKGWTVT